MDLHWFDIVLGMLWTTTTRPLFLWEQRKLTYRSDDDRPKALILVLQAFSASMRKAVERMYAVSITLNPDYLHEAAARKEAGILSENGRIPPEFKDLNEVFPKTRAQAVPRHGKQGLTIELVEGKEPSWGPI
jgi:hypothetical protein